MFLRTGLPFLILKETETSGSSLLGWEAQNTFTAGNRPFRITLKLTFIDSYKNCLQGSKNSTCCSVKHKVSGLGYSLQKSGQSLPGICNGNLIIMDSPKMNTHFERQWNNFWNSVVFCNKNTQNQQKKSLTYITRRTRPHRT
jgi:hypothetical protein